MPGLEYDYDQYSVLRGKKKIVYAHTHKILKKKQEVAKPQNENKNMQQKVRREA